MNPNPTSEPHELHSWEYVRKDSDVEAFVVREIDHVVKSVDKKENYYDGSFFNFEDTKHQRLSRLKHEEIDVWSSKRGNIPDKKR